MYKDLAAFIACLAYEAVDFCRFNFGQKIFALEVECPYTTVGEGAAVFWSHEVASSNLSSPTKALRDLQH